MSLAVRQIRAGALRAGPEDGVGDSAGPAPGADGAEMIRTLPGTRAPRRRVLAQRYRPGPLHPAEGAA